MDWGTSVGHEDSWLKGTWLTLRPALALLRDERVSTAAKLIIPPMWLLYFLTCCQWLVRWMIWQCCSWECAYWTLSEIQDTVTEARTLR